MLRNQGGFTLIELLVTITFIGIIIVTFTLSFTNSITIGKLSEHHNQALNLAGMIMENLLTYDYTSEDLTAGEHPYDLSTLSTGFTATYRVEDPVAADADKWDDAGNPLIKTLTVTVRWEDRQHSRQVELTTYRAKTQLASD